MSGYWILKSKVVWVPSKKSGIFWKFEGIICSSHPKTRCLAGLELTTFNIKSQVCLRMRGAALSYKLIALNRRQLEVGKEVYHWKCFKGH